jgi:hypothetical protein
MAQADKFTGVVLGRSGVRELTIICFGREHSFIITGFVTGGWKLYSGGCDGWLL